MPVDAQHKEYSESIQRWKDIDNATSKTNLTQYLRELNPADKSKDNVKRNEHYKKFAVYYNFPGYTLNGLTGEVFSDDPQIELPAGLEYLQDNFDGQGNSINQCSRGSVREVNKKGRSGLFTSFPETNGPVSRADIVSGRVLATTQPIDAKRIVNWRETVIDGVRKLSLVVFSESDDQIDDDGFAVTSETIYRELRLEDGIYVDRKWKKNKTGKFEVISQSNPLDGKGNNWEVIPFSFIGSVNNDSTVDKIDMSDLVDISLALYRNSADFEDSVWYSGQAQPWMSGLDENLIQVMKKEGIYTGGRLLMPVPEGEVFDYASAPPNPVVRQAMMDKVDLLLSMGARFIQPGGVAKTASQSNSESQVSHSILSLIASNVSDAYEKHIGFSGRYMNVDTKDAKYRLKTDFLPEGSTSEDIKAMVEGWVKGAVPGSDYVRYMQKIKRFDPKKTVQELLEELEVNA